MILRRFLFLDEPAVEDYLGAVEGSVPAGPFEQTDIEKQSKGGKAGVSKIVTVEGNAAAESSTETKQTRSVPGSARFQRLYDSLQKQHAIQRLDAFDSDIWQQLQRGEVLEIEAQIRVPSMFLVGEATDFADPLARLMALFGQNPLADPTVQAQFEQAKAVAQLLAKEPIPLLFEAVSTPSFRFVASLPREHLISRPSELQGEAVVFGKVQRVIPKKTSYEFSLIRPALLAAIRPQNRAQRRSSKHLDQGQGGQEKIKGPGVVLEVIAVYR